MTLVIDKTEYAYRLRGECISHLLSQDREVSHNLSDHIPNRHS